MARSIVVPTKFQANKTEILSYLMLTLALSPDHHPELHLVASGPVNTAKEQLSPLRQLLLLCSLFLGSPRVEQMCIKVAE